MLKFWENPLLILHVRADLRPARAAVLAAVALVVCALVAMGCWSDAQNAHKFWGEYYYWLLGLQFVALGTWSAGTCGQSVARERDLKTFDFLKTTRLTAGEIMVGKILGAPIVAYFVVACTLPITLVAGVLGGIRLTAMFGSILLLVVFNLFYSLVALLGSMLVERSSSGAAGLLGLLPNLLFLAFADSDFKGFTALSVIPALFSLHRADVNLGHLHPTVFGFQVPCLLLTLVLYVLFGAWLVAMLMRNLKRDLPEIQLLTRWKCVGLVAFWNLLFYAFLDVKSLHLVYWFGPRKFESWQVWPVVLGAVGLNALSLFLIGIAALSPHEKLKVWWRQWKSGAASYFSADGLPWPWLVPAAMIGYGMMAVEALGLRVTVPLKEWHLGFTALVFTAFLVYTARDILFLQWCLLTRMTHPVLKGVLFLVLYNVAAGLVGVMVSAVAAPATPRILALLFPYVLFRDQNSPPIPAGFIVGGMVLQAGICVLVHLAIQNRLGRPVRALQTATA